jgi:hypothetical protein
MYYYEKKCSLEAFAESEATPAPRSKIKPILHLVYDKVRKVFTDPCKLMAMGAVAVGVGYYMGRGTRHKKTRHKKKTKRHKKKV